MPEITYSREFREKALSLASIGAKKCERCGCLTWKKGRQGRTVRVVLNGTGEPAPHMLHLFCTDCYPDQREVKLSRSKILAKIAELPFEQPEAAKSANG